MPQMFYILLAFIPFGLRSQNPAYFLSNPSLTPDGETVVFCFEGDLWKADVQDGMATRLTAMQGYESSPRVSPDGQWIAFTGRQYGNGDVFVIPLKGGEVRTLTHHSANEEMRSWSWDSKTIYFNSYITGKVASHQVSAEGGTPVRVFGDQFFLYDHNLAEHPVTGELFFNDTWESDNQLARKRYKGPFNPDIQSYHPKTKQYKKYTTWEGKDFGTTIDRKGNIYYISDQANGEYNLYTLNRNTPKALTSFSTSIKSPQVNAQGGRVVFEKDYQLWIYEVRSGKARPLAISIHRNPILPKEKDFELKGQISAYDLSPDGKKMALVSRGELFVSDAEGKFIRHLKRPTSERVKEVKWLSNNKTLLFNQTLDGYSNWFTMPADSLGAPVQVTGDKKNNRSLALNSKRTLGVYLSGRDEVRLLELSTMESRTLVKDEIWGLQNSTPGFSPNDEYVVYTAYKNFEQDLYAIHLKENKIINLTRTDVTETGPQWSSDGHYVYFISQRLKPAYPFGMGDAKVYRLPLEKLDAPFKMDKYNELFKEEKKDTTKISPADSLKPILIDPDGIMERVEQISPALGTQFLQALYQKGDQTSVLYSSNHGEGKYALWKTVIGPFEPNKTEKISGTDNASRFDIVEAGNKLYSLHAGNVHKLNLDGNKAELININYTFRKNLSDEFNQMFYEAWAQMEENFYDGQFHGLDWQKAREQYKAYLPHLNTRADLRVLLNDLLGELNSSHQGFGTFGDDETIDLQNQTMETGIVFEPAHPYTVQRIVKRSAADKKGIDIRPGDVLIKVNEETVDPSRDRHAYFTRPSRDQELSLVFSRQGQAVTARLHPQASLFNEYYEEWIDQNQKRVDDKSNKRIAYGYMKNMGRGELDQFIIDMTGELNQKEALILDLRYNTGGNVHDEVLKFLSQRSYLQWKYRDGKLSPQSNFAPSDKPLVLLTNEQSLSDAEMTAQGFKALKLGKIIGNETYRWIIFTTGIGLVDGSFIRMPSWGCYTMEGKNLEQTGVQPDILIINGFVDKLNGRDPQLDRAIDEILKLLK
ncbi:MAG TPA: S41 family peptidase [Saprospiraceae bacterium]|nr:S41 family peptidase [Saprospiraceae bacterium]HNT20714.1 S41 family peptidase [Saprospiraceae bacterium]